MKWHDMKPCWENRYLVTHCELHDGLLNMEVSISLRAASKHLERFEARLVGHCERYSDPPVLYETLDAAKEACLEIYRRFLAEAKAASV